MSKAERCWKSPHAAVPWRFWFPLATRAAASVSSHKVACLQATATSSIWVRRWRLSVARRPPVNDSGWLAPTSGDVVYLDSSALVKLVVAERESTALRRYLRREPLRASCALARVEVIRAVRPHGPRAATRARQVLRRLDLVRLDDDILDDAATLDHAVLRSLDAIHLAAARTLGEELTAVVTYDERMTKAAGLLGLVVEAPR